MQSSIEVTFLGTGTSHGVPMLDCMLSNYAHCPKQVCREAETDPRHRRTRSSIALHYNSKTVLIDVSPDFREQALREKIMAVDALLLTHRHADHIMGIPDIRSYSRLLNRPIDTYGSAETIDHVRKTFAYIFDPDTFVGGGIPRLETHPVDGPFELFGKTVAPIPVVHGPQPGCFGFRIENLAYIPDMKEISGKSIELLKDLDCLILNCLRDTRPHPTHMLLSDSMAFARTIRPKQCYFIHMCHDINYRTDTALLDPWMSFSYDGLRMNTGT